MSNKEIHSKAPKLFSAMRTWDIALGTFQQLVRMKVFYFVIGFALILLAANLVEDPFAEGPAADETYVLYKIKGWATGTMTLFLAVFAIVGTALLLPRDVEDRTLYTILAKPVPRLDYLAGKFLGVVMLLAASTLIMDVLMVITLEIRTEREVAYMAEKGASLGKNEAEIAVMSERIREYAPDWQLQAAVLGLFLKAVVVCALALFFSTFSTSTLFTVVATTLVFFIGHFVGDIRDYMENSSGGISTMDRLWTGIVMLVLPDFGLFNLTDAALDGTKITLSIVGKITGITALYSMIYIVISWFVFADKEL